MASILATKAETLVPAGRTGMLGYLTDYAAGAGAPRLIWISSIYETKESIRARPTCAAQRRGAAQGQDRGAMLDGTTGREPW